jgi:hypothetical protein
MGAAIALGGVPNCCQRLQAAASYGRKKNFHAAYDRARAGDPAKLTSDGWERTVHSSVRPAAIARRRSDR